MSLDQIGSGHVERGGSKERPEMSLISSNYMIQTYRKEVAAVGDSIDSDRNGNSDS